MAQNKLYFTFTDDSYKTNNTYIRGDIIESTSFVEEGFYFTDDVKNILKYWTKYIYLTEVILDKTDQYFKMVANGPNFWRSNVFKIGKKYSMIDDVSTYKYLIEIGVDVSGNFGLLTKAIENDSLAVVEFLLQLNQNSYFRSDEFLDTALERGNLAMVKLLIENGVTPYEIVENQIVNLAINNHFDIIDYLTGSDVKMQVSPKIFVKLAKTDPVRLAKIGKLYMIKYFVDKGVDVHRVKREACDQSVRTRDIETTKYFVEIGVSANLVINTAAEYGDVEIVKYLIETGAKVDDTVLTDAAKSSQVDVIKYLLEESGLFTDIVKIAENLLIKGYKCLDMIKYLVNKGATDSDIIGKVTTLAAAEGQLDVVKYLLTVDDDFSVRDALFAAVTNGHLDVVKVLAEEIHIQSDTCILQAIKNQDLCMVKYLIESGVDVDRSILIAAAKTKNYIIYKYLANCLSNQGLNMAELFFGHSQQ